MLVIPAIDLRGGRCVRLVQGDFDRETVFSEDPAGVAQQWASAGASMLHVVDLDGAASGKLANGDALRTILASVAIPVQFGGGVRSPAILRKVIDWGVVRVIMGTAAVRDNRFLRQALEWAPERIVVSIDARDGWVAVAGWRETEPVSALDLAQHLAEIGVCRFVYTDIARDGTMTQPNYTAIAEMVGLGVPVLASGGIACLEHLLRLRDLGVEGAIVGRALYSGQLDLAEAIAAVKGG